MTQSTELLEHLRRYETILIEKPHYLTDKDPQWEHGLSIEAVNVLAIAVHGRQLIAYSNGTQQRTLTFYSFTEDTQPVTWLTWAAYGFADMPVFDQGKREATLDAITSWIAPTVLLVSEQKNNNQQRKRKGK